MPPSIGEWVSDDSVARFVSERVEQLEAEGKLESFYSPDRADGWGGAAYHPRMRVKVILPA